MTKIVKRKISKFSDVEVGEYFENAHSEEEEAWQKVAFCGSINASVLVKDKHGCAMEVEFQEGSGMAVNRRGTLAFRGKDFPVKKIHFAVMELS